MEQAIQAILIGAGQRGADAYGPYALEHPAELRFVAVAEPDPGRRARFARQHGIPAERQFESWEALLALPQLGQARLGKAALICTQDQLHTEPTLAALRQGYDVLLEKPMATTADECRLLANTASRLGRQLHICHVLRYTEHFQKMKTILQSGVLGQIVNVSHRENVAWWHMAHSFVRGNWRNTAESAPMILAKCCHDLDILTWLLDDRALQLSSTGRLLHYRPENAPQGAPQRCLNGCPVAESCPYYAPRIYIEHQPIWQGLAETGSGLPRWAARQQLRRPGLISTLSKVFPLFRQISDYRGWPSSVVALDPTPENLQAALQDGPYGRCVYYCDNDVVDQQVVTMQFESGPSVTLTMHGHSHLEGRTTRIEGSRATLLSAFGYGGSWIEVSEHSGGNKKRYDTRATVKSGHGGGDTRLMAAFLRALRENNENAALTTAQRSLESHLMAFAAEEARLAGQVVRMEDYRL